MALGYNVGIVEKNKDADDSRIGVHLGRVCIAKNISVTTVASEFGVSRQTVYNWFSGTTPAEHRAAEIEAFLSLLT
jgi:hypothetical protein